VDNFGKFPPLAERRCNFESLAVYSNPSFSPDGTKIVFLRGNAYDRENSAFDGGQTGNADLVWISADGGSTNLILPARGAGGRTSRTKKTAYTFTRRAGWYRCATTEPTAAHICR